MTNIAGHQVGAACMQYAYLHGCEKRFAGKHLCNGLQLAFRILFIVIVCLFQLFVQLAFSATVHFGFVAVLAKIFGNICLVGIEIQHNNHPAECLHGKHQQQ